MNEQLKKLANKAWKKKYSEDSDYSPVEEFAKLVIEETLKQVDERVYGRGENQWYYNDDKKWIYLHFGYGELMNDK